VYAFHGWLDLASSPYEDDTERVLEVMSELEAMSAAFDWPNLLVEIRMLNGTGFLGVTGRFNRRRVEAIEIWKLVRYAAERLPGSSGLIYERDDETADPPGPNAHKVTVLARGVFHVREDSFLSPCNPVVEDCG
jgi:hypothetical protein